MAAHAPSLILIYCPKIPNRAFFQVGQEQTYTAKFDMPRHGAHFGTLPKIPVSGLMNIYIYH